MSSYLFFSFFLLVKSSFILCNSKAFRKVLEKFVGTVRLLLFAVFERAEFWPPKSADNRGANNSGLTVLHKSWAY